MADLFRDFGFRFSGFALFTVNLITPESFLIAPAAGYTLFPSKTWGEIVSDSVYVKYHRFARR
jgi:hypothetical protein